ncbi:ABC transporter substrate-binding protein [Terrabacter sp. LjRoot27]|uniref:ABC transporter substrate-binding protein n=1 Tax=Terrabacter sp. LjRoot27 TaxID=3342306 RepID=UPI003ED0009F
MKLTTKLCAAGATLATTAALGLVPAAAASAAPSSAPSAAQAASTPRTTATSTINQVIAGVGTFAGSFTPTAFTNQNGQLAVTGVVTGTLTTLTGAVVPVTQTVTTTVAGATAAGSCDILNLVLGPLHLDVLGLVVDLNQVVLNITGATGAGNLLGNLLCAITGLLDGSGVNGLATLLNRLLGL